MSNVNQESDHKQDLKRIMESAQRLGVRIERKKPCSGWQAWPRAGMTTTSP
jgi:hypothetical protein